MTNPCYKPKLLVHCHQTAFWHSLQFDSSLRCLCNGLRLLHRPIAFARLSQDRRLHLPEFLLQPPIDFADVSLNTMEIVLQILLHLRRTIALESIMDCAYLGERLGGADLGTKKKLCPLSLVLLLHRGSGMESESESTLSSSYRDCLGEQHDTSDDYYDPCKLTVVHCLVFILFC
ncbi:hypothetical protein C8J56DRAFT_79657 [Mycena floridula]|nr:hypothetical protein C8J56DRAFT_79657 [Mycena floridula]